MKNRNNADQMVINIFEDRIGDLITERKSETKKELKDLAKEIGVASGTLSSYQNGTVEAGITKLKRLSEYFGVSCDFLLGDADCPKPDVESVHRYTGISDGAIKKLVKYKDYALKFRANLNALLECDELEDLVDALEYFIEELRLVRYLRSLPANELVEKIADPYVVRRLGDDAKQTAEVAIGRRKDHMDFIRWKITSAIYKTFDGVAENIERYYPE